MNSEEVLRLVVSVLGDVDELASAMACVDLESTIDFVPVLSLIFEQSLPMLRRKP